VLEILAEANLRSIELTANHRYHLQFSR